MTRTGAGGAGEGQSPDLAGSPAAGETVLRLMPSPATRPTQVAKAARNEPAASEETTLDLEHLPKEAGWALITAGVVGLAVPGILGTPFLLAGAFVVAPGGPKLLSRWVGRNPPRFVGFAMRQIGRFLDDLERRYPRR
jgi:FAD/FMN-containing dehydrogenase